MVRDNLNFLNIFRLDDTNLNQVFHEKVGGDMKLDKFKEMCNNCWNQDDFGFVTIDLTRKAHDGNIHVKNSLVVPSNKC